MGIGDSNGTPKVACPLHKKTFSLESGSEIDGDLQILTFETKIEGDNVMVNLPSVEEVDAILGTHGLRVTKSDCINLAEDAIKVQLQSERNVKQSSTALMATSEETSSNGNFIKGLATNIAKVLNRNV